MNTKTVWDHLDAWTSLATRIIAIGGFLLALYSLGTTTIRDWVIAAVIDSGHVEETVGYQLDERLTELEDMVDSAVQNSQVLEGMMTAPRVPGPEVRFSNGGRWGNWSDPLYCPAGHYVCGLRQRVEPDIGERDDSAMNAVAFYCCPLDPNLEP